MKNAFSLFCGLFLISARLYAGNDTYTSLHVFTALSGTSPATNDDGGNPTTGLILASNVLYGAGRVGGISNSGTIFSLNADGTGFTTLHNFTNGIDGENPSGAGCLVFSSNAIFGVTSFGGTNVPPPGHSLSNQCRWKRIYQPLQLSRH
jgi:uncharacterized repeat protein (TIGR03803 family)